VNDDQQPRRRAHANDDEPVFIIGMLRIEKHSGMRVVEDALSLLESHAMF
jgi:hypothetical protein